MLFDDPQALVHCLSLFQMKYRQPVGLKASLKAVYLLLLLLLLEEFQPLRHHLMQALQVPLYLFRFPLILRHVLPSHRLFYAMLQQLHPQRIPVNLEQEFRLSFYFPLNYSFFKNY